MRARNIHLLVVILGLAVFGLVPVLLLACNPRPDDAASRNDSAQQSEVRVGSNLDERRTGQTETQGPNVAAARDASSSLLCVPEADLLRLVENRSRLAVAADEAGHLAFYGGASVARGREGTTTEDSYDILNGCLPQLAYTNHATVLVEGRGPEDARPDNVRDPTRKTSADPGDNLTTAFGFPGGVRLEQKLSLKDGTLHVDYSSRTVPPKAKAYP